MRRAVAPLPLRKVSAPTESWWDLAPSAKRNESTPLSALHADKAPLYLRRPDVHYWFERLPERGLLYFQYNRSMEMQGGQSLKDFGQEHNIVFCATEWAGMACGNLPEQPGFDPKGAVG